MKRNKIDKPQRLTLYLHESEVAKFKEMAKKDRRTLRQFFCIMFEKYQEENQ